MTNVEVLQQIMQALSMVLAMPDFLGKDDVEQHLRWAGKQYAERIYLQSLVNN